jgi:hypothetical protein
MVLWRMFLALVGRFAAAASDDFEHASSLVVPEPSIRLARHGARVAAFKIGGY